MTTSEKNYHPDTHPEHRDVSGGWLRPAVFGAMDGLVTNVSLISGVGGGGGSQHAIVLTGLAGLAAGAFSMAAGEFVSVSSQNELIQAEVDKERHELIHNAAAEQAELAGMLRRRGVSAGTARQAAAEISAHPDKALGFHTLEELGVNTAELPSPAVAAGASLASFAVGALVPLFPYLLGFDALGVALGLSALAAVIGGGLVARLTNRPFWRGAARQLILGAARRGHHVPDRPRGRRHGRLTRQERFTPPATWPRTRSRRRTSAARAPRSRAATGRAACAPARAARSRCPWPAAGSRPWPR